MEEKKKPSVEKTVAQEYFENAEIKRKIPTEIQKIIDNIPKETYQQLLDSFDNDKLSLYSAIQTLFSHGVEKIETIISVLTYKNYKLTIWEQLILAKMLEYNYLPEEAKKQFMSSGFSQENIDILTSAFSDLKYGKKQDKKTSKSSPKHYSGDFPGDFRDL